MKTKLLFLTITLFFCSLSHSQGIWITNNTGCKFFSPSDKGNPSFEWDGKCVDSFVSGTGTLKLYQKTYEQTYNQIQTKLTFTYNGAISNGKFNGQGKITYDNGTIYIGEFKDNLTSGQGTFIWSDGVKYFGEFQNGERNGLGIIELKNGEKFNVQYKNDKLIQDKTIADKLQTNDFSANFIEWNCLNLKSNTLPIQALSRNMFDCYNDLSTKYDTPLKREVFTKSKEYAELYNKYKANQLTYLNNSYYYFILENCGIGDYDMGKGGFEITFNNFQSKARSSEESFDKYYNLFYKPVNIFCIKSGEFYLSIPTIPVQERYYAVNGESFDDRSVSLSIRVDKSKALEIENNRDKLNIYFITLGPIKRGNIYKDNLSIWIKSEYKNEISEYYLTNKARLVIANKETGQIYYNKLYAPTPPQKKLTPKK